MNTPTLRLGLRRIGAGSYAFGHYTVERSADGWRWQDADDLSTGGEWRSTLREASLDLDAYLSAQLRAAPDHGDGCSALDGGTCDCRPNR